LTSAHKDEELQEFEDENRVTFLKREFSFRDGDWLAPLSKKSIWKMLGWELRSKSVTPFERALAVMDNAQREAWFHEREFFDEVTLVVVTAAGQLGLAFDPWTWEELFEYKKSGDYSTWDA